MPAPTTELDVSIVLPVHNEAGHLQAEIDRIAHAMDVSAYSWELIIVDDGSDDGSEEIATADQRTRVIRADKTNPNHRAPIIALTASALLDDRRKALAAGMDEHLTKPFTPDQLKAAIQTQLSRSGESNPAERVPLPLAFRVTKVKQEHIDMYFGGDMDYAKEMVLEFLRSLPSERENIGRLIQSKDSTALSNWLHSMYPVVAMLGAPELSKEIKTKQLTVNESEWTDDLVLWSEQLDIALSDLGDELEKWVEGQVA